MRENFPHFSDQQWSAVERIHEVAGDAIFALLGTHTAEYQRQLNSAREQYESLHGQVQNLQHQVAEHDNVNMRDQTIQNLQQQVADSHQQSVDLQRHLLDVSSQMAQTAREAVPRPPVDGGRPRPVVIKVTTFEGKETDNLPRWLLEVETSAAAQLIVRDDLRIAFAMSHLAGRARDWAFTQKLGNAHVFPSWEIFEQELKRVFQPPNSDFRYRAKFLSCKQGNRTMDAYIQDVRFLAACIVDISTLPEPTRVTVFMQGLKAGPAKTQLFRSFPSTLEEAIRIASSEAFSCQMARSDPWKGQEATDMDVSVVENTNVKCFGCGRLGHFRQNCPSERGNKNARGHANRSFQRPQHSNRNSNYARRDAHNPRVNNIKRDVGTSSHQGNAISQ
jgi:hypothetical protein